MRRIIVNPFPIFRFPLRLALRLIAAFDYQIQNPNLSGKLRYQGFGFAAIFFTCLH